MMKLLLLQLLVTAACGHTFLVVRKGGAARCISNEREYQQREILPIIKFESAKPQVTERIWSQSWMLEGLKTAESKIPDSFGGGDYRLVVTNGSTWPQPLGTKSFAIGEFFVFVQASNATLIFTEGEGARDEGVKLHLDHFQGEGEEKRSWAEHCTGLGTPQEACEALRVLDKDGAPTSALHVSGGFLEGGRSWMRLKIDFFGDELRVWKFQQEILLFENRMEPKSVSVQTYWKPGAFYFQFATWVVPTGGPNRLIRTFQVGPSKRICVRVTWGWFTGTPGSYALFNSKQERVQSGPLVEEAWRTTLRFDLASEGQYRLELINITKAIYFIGECPGESFEISHSAVGCAVMEKKDNQVAVANVFVGFMNHSIRVDLRQGQLEHVCSTLEVPSVVKNTNLKFCNHWGCKFQRCSGQNLSNANRTLLNVNLS